MAQSDQIALASTIHVDISVEAVPHLVAYCREKFANLPITVVSDTNTYPVLGQRVRDEMISAGFQVINIVLSGEEVVANEHYLVKVFLSSHTGDQVFIAVGSGTITDITRYVAFRTRNPYISVPTAPSVDGFVSVSAPLIVGVMKETFPTNAPVAVFGDLETLKNAPKAMIAAGFGDILGKYTSLADWKLGHLLRGEPHDTAVEERVRSALNSCVASVDAIASRSEAGIYALMNALLESGLGMLEFGNSRPASGAEHHCSHYWEMKLLREGKPALLHGAKVGFATSLIARQYQRLRNLSREDLLELLEASELQPRDQQVADIERVYPGAAEDILRIQQPYLDMKQDEYDTLKQDILQNWQAVRSILDAVPPPEIITGVLRQLGGASQAEDLCLSESTVQEALLYGHYLRDRFTVMKLSKIIGLSVL